MTALEGGSESGRDEGKGEDDDGGTHAEREWVGVEGR